MSAFVLDRKDFDAVLFDLDGVLTDSAALHAQSWKVLFDSFLQGQAIRKERSGDFRSFDADHDYRAFVDGKPRHDGIRSFLASRAIAIPEGEPEDEPTKLSVYGLGARKNALFHQALARDGVDIFPAAVAFLKSMRPAGFKTALVSSSRNSRAITADAGLDGLFDAWVDGDAVGARRLQGKPAPDMFQAAAADLGVSPSRAVVLEDAIAGVEAGRRGGFGLVIGVDRTHHPEALAKAGADLVLSNLGDLVIAAEEPSSIDEQPPLP